MRTPSRRLAGLLVAVLVGLPAPALAAAADPLGGPALDTTGLVVRPGAPALPPLTAAAWLVADLDTGEVLAAQDPHGRYLPASTLKVLTALALLPEIEMDQPIQPTFEDVNVIGSKVGIVESVTYPASELFEALLMSSGNDAAGALATAYGGVEQTAALMNDVAEQLQARDTLAVNPSGLDAPGQLTSAYDLALIARAALERPDFATLVTTLRSSISAPGGARFEIASGNRLLRNYAGAIGVKNGYTDAARGTFVGAAEKDGRRLVVTLLQADPRVWAEAALLLDWGFAAGDVDPVGTLVEPLPDEPPPAPAPVRAPVAVQPAAAGAPVDDTGLPVLPAAAVVSVLVAAVVVVRRRFA